MTKYRIFMMTKDNQNYNVTYSFNGRLLRESTEIENLPSEIRIHQTKNLKKFFGNVFLGAVYNKRKITLEIEL